MKIIKTILLVLFFGVISQDLLSQNCSCCPTGWLPAPVSLAPSSPGAPPLYICGADWDPVGHCCIPFGGDY